MKKYAYQVYVGLELYMHREPATACNGLGAMPRAIAVSAML